MKILIDRDTGQGLLPGVTNNRECGWSTESGFGQDYRYCDDGKVDYGEETEDCPYCKGTGVHYEEVEYADEQRVQTA